MGNCLVTKLKESVNNSDYRKIGEARIFVHQTENPDYGSTGTMRLIIKSSENQTIECIGGSFVNSEGTPTSTSYDLVANTERTLICGNGNYYISIPNKYALTKIKCFRSLSMNIDDLNMSNLYYLDVGNDNCKGDIMNLSNGTFTELLLIAGATNITGDIAILPSSCKNMYIAYTNVYGNLTDIKSKQITAIVANDCSNLKGDLDAFATDLAVGRSAGSTLICNFIRAEGVTYNDQPLKNAKTITFDGAGGYTIN